MTPPHDQPRDDELAAPPSPVGSGPYVVQAGDCLSSIAEAHGFHWRTVWEHDRNAELRRARGNPNVLYPGDRVWIPEPRQVEQACAVNETHRFTVKGVPAKLRIRFLEGGEPRAREAYILLVDGVPRRGRLDADGVLEESISPLARAASILFDGDRDPLSLALGWLPPIDTVAGVQARLGNLGFDAGPADGLLGPRTRRALRRFQRRAALEISGEPDAPTIQALQTRHGA